MQQRRQRRRPITSLVAKGQSLISRWSTSSGCFEQVSSSCSCSSSKSTSRSSTTTKSASRHSGAAAKEHAAHLWQWTSSTPVEAGTADHPCTFCLAKKALLHTVVLFLTQLLSVQINIPATCVARQEVHERDLWSSMAYINTTVIWNLVKSACYGPTSFGCRPFGKFATAYILAANSVSMHS